MNTETGIETWMPVTDYDGLYEVSNGGRIYSIIKGRILKPWSLKSNGYLMITLYNNERIPKKKSVHSIVLESFKGKRPLNAVCRHLDGNKLNNCLENLEWGTSKENYNDSRIHGTNCQGVRNGFAKLKDEDIRKIRTLRKTGITYVELGKMFNTDWSNVMLICKHRTWKHVI